MSTQKSVFDLILENDENEKKWKRQVMETENLIKSMQNDLEVEQAKETLVLTEMRGKILQVEQLTSNSNQQANDRLQTLMVDQLIEINKSEILVKVNEENYKQCAHFLQEISRWEPNMPEIIVTGTHVGREKGPDIQSKDEGADELGDDERKTIEEDISKIEEAIAESEKEHEVLKEFLTEHQKLLTEIESGTQVEILKSRKRLCDSQDHTTVPQGIIAPTQKPRESLIYQSDPNMGLSARTVAPSSPDPSRSCSVPRPKVQNRTFAAKSAIISKKIQHPMDRPREDTTEGFMGDFPNSESFKSTSKAETILPMKKTKLNLYDTPGVNQRTALNIQTPQTKSTTTFKPKIPSALRNRIN